jgi:hypothetical protein
LLLFKFLPEFHILSNFKVTSIQNFTFYQTLNSLAFTRFNPGLPQIPIKLKVAFFLPNFIRPKKRRNKLQMFVGICKKEPGLMWHSNLQVFLPIYDPLSLLSVIVF